MTGWHIVGFVALLFGMLAFRATEYYATRYQSLPVQDWLEAHPPFAEAGSVPTAADLSRGLVHTAPLLSIRDDARPLVTVFGPPAENQRTIGGVRDAARIEYGVANASQSDVPIRVRLDVLVFNRAERAAAWADLLAREFDIKEIEQGYPQARISGPESPDRLWLSDPRVSGGQATVAGQRGPVAFELLVQYQGAGQTAEDRVDRTARAEVLARQVAEDWVHWLETELASAA